MDQQTGVLHAICWLNQIFWCFIIFFHHKWEKGESVNNSTTQKTYQRLGATLKCCSLSGPGGVPLYIVGCQGASSFTARGFSCVDSTKGIRLIGLRVTKLPQLYNKNTCLTLVKPSYICIKLTKMKF